MVELRKDINWGPEVEQLPTLNHSQIQESISNGKCLIILEEYVYDVTSFLREHPGGDKILKAYAGRDATAAFNGGSNVHTQSARLRAHMMIIGKLAQSNVNCQGS